MAIKLIGYWRGDLMCDDYCYPQEVGRCEDPQLQQAILRHLREGYIHEGYRGYSWCRFRCGVDHKEMGTREFTDGVWYWPEGLVHYVEEHDIKLPEAFCDFVHTGTRGKRNLLKADTDTSFWNEWCKSQRLPEVAEQIYRLREEYSLQVAAQLEADSITLEEERGLSDIPCIVRGCTVPALAEVVYCAKHWITKDGQPIDVGPRNFTSELIDMANKAFE